MQDSEPKKSKTQEYYDMRNFCIYFFTHKGYIYEGLERSLHNFFYKCKRKGYFIFYNVHIGYIGYNPDVKFGKFQCIWKNKKYKLSQEIKDAFDKKVIEIKKFNSERQEKYFDEIFMRMENIENLIGKLNEETKYLQELNKFYN